jgi:3-dehydroquinate synthase
MVMAARLSAALALIDDRVVERLADLLNAGGLPSEPPLLSVDDWHRWMASDKKAEGGRLRFILLEALGRARVSTVDDSTLDALLRDAGTRQAVRA